ncbi:MAG: RNA polymerase sigma factor [Gemmatimonadota bacterium]
MEVIARRPEPADERMEAAELGRTLVARARQGDLGAFEALYRMHAGRTHALALRMVGDPREAEEVTQDIWVRTWEAIDSFRGDSSFTTWLHRLAVNRVLDHLRSRKRRESRSMPLDDPAALARSTPGDSTEDRLELERALAGLPDGARTAFVLHEVEGMKCREVAEIQGVAVGTVKAQLHRARRLLRERLTP